MPFDGYKTYLAAIGAMALGVYQATQGHLEQGIETFLAGLAVLGVGHKLAKVAG